MAGSSRAVKAAEEGRGFPYTSLPKDYRIILPPLPSGEPRSGLPLRYLPTESTTFECLSRC
ncbi:hypothetical protein HPB50_002509 [Hyalomma asiaticum]|uniref:Uncharacterized protein n=1 Tax=Hyalomma asiaticum TaxID=266040 RepID=A0ACB7SBS5_HYAAI|nr:hypothetical protein HPB50_002509 [Hyalomma asiaticum]